MKRLYNTKCENHINLKYLILDERAFRIVAIIKFNKYNGVLRISLLILEKLI